MRVGMIRRVDNLGRVTIPKEYRDFYNLSAGEKISIIETENGLLLTHPEYKVVKIENVEEK